MKYPDHGQHARDIERQIAQVRERHQKRTAVLGINPDLVVVVIFNRSASVMDEKLAQAGLQSLAATGRQAMAAFSSDPEMADFLSRLERYGRGPVGQQSAYYEDLFDSIELVRSLEPGDVIDPDVQAELQEHRTELLRLDIQCWCPESMPDARRRFDETRRAINAAGGAVVDSSFRYEAGLSIIRADVRPAAVWKLAAIDRVRQISLLPRPLLTMSAVAMAGLDRIPPVLPPAPQAPVIAVIDSGIREAHPLLAPAVEAALSASDHIPDGADENGHGTLVASLALYGSLEQKLQSKAPLRPAGRLLSIRVLDSRGYFPDATVWAEHLASAIRLAAGYGAKVVNLSLGDRRQPYRPPGPTAVAALVDDLAREFDLVIVVSAGNFPYAEYPRDPDIASVYPTWLLDHEEAGLLPPAMSALALTAGALVPDKTQGARPVQDSVDVQLLGKPGRPSPVTRVGPGIEEMTKPELMAPGGTYAYDTGLCQFRETPYGKVVGAAALPPDRLLTADAGTSFAAPLVSHAALRVLGRYPMLSANAVRALLLATAGPVDPVLDGSTDGVQRNVQLKLSGYGRVSAERAEFSADYRAVLLAEDALRTDQVHFYSVPVPDSFFNSGSKMVALGLAFDPKVRSTRLKYLASHMSVFVYRGVAVEMVRAKYAIHSEDDAPPTELDRFLCEIQPADQTRLRGANQAGRKVWKKAWDNRYRNGELVIVVRNTNRWAPAGDVQRYALALTIQTREDMEPPVYQQLRARLSILAEIKPEIELGL